MTAVNMLIVPYKATAQAITAVVAGESDLTIGDFGLINPHVKSGKLRGLAVTSAQPSALAPALPTVAASGLAGYELIGMTSLYVPAKTPAAIIKRLNQEILRVLTQPDVKRTFLQAEVEVVASSPEQLSTPTMSR